MRSVILLQKEARLNKFALSVRNPHCSSLSPLYHLGNNLLDYFSSFLGTEAYNILALALLIPFKDRPHLCYFEFSGMSTICLLRLPSDNHEYL